MVALFPKNEGAITESAIKDITGKWYTFIPPDKNLIPYLLPYVLVITITLWPYSIKPKIIFNYT